MLWLPLLAVLLPSNASAQSARDLRRAERLVEDAEEKVSEKKKALLTEENHKAAVRDVALRLAGGAKIESVKYVLYEGNPDGLKSFLNSHSGLGKVPPAKRYTILEKEEQLPDRREETSTQVEPLPPSCPIGLPFDDNKYALRDASGAAVKPQQLQQLIDQLEALTGDLGENDQIVEIVIHTSASTLRNTGDVKEHCKLSQLRAEAVREELRRYLAEQGLDAPEGLFTLMTEGDNKNCTSGPSSPFPCSQADREAGLCPDGSGPAPGDVQKAADLLVSGKVLDNTAARETIRAFYEQFKYLKLEIVVRRTTTHTIVEEGDPYAKLVAISVQTESSSSGGWEWPNFQGRPKSHKPKKSKPGVCPRW